MHVLLWNLFISFKYFNIINQQISMVTGRDISINSPILATTANLDMENLEEKMSNSLEYQIIF